MTGLISYDRRNFLFGSTKSALLLPLLGLDLLSCRRQATAGNSQAGVPWSITIVPEKEPGEPLIVSGTIYSTDGRTPMGGARLYIYQTDATGRYSTSGGGDNRNTRLHGAMQTNSQGQYQFRTIKPASYPGSRIPAHIHAYVSGPGYPEYWIDEYHFDDDPFVTDEMRRRFGQEGNFSSILKLTRGADGILRGARDIKIELCSRNCI